eukprot:959933_1
MLFARLSQLPQLYCAFIEWFDAIYIDITRLMESNIDDPFSSIRWKVKHTQKQYKLCNSLTNKCANMQCNIEIYKGKTKVRRKQSNARKSFGINNNLRKQIYAAHELFLGPNHRFCGECKQIAINNVSKLKFQSKSVSHPSFAPLDSLLSSRDPPVNHELLGDAEFQLFCGFDRSQMKTIKAKANALIEGKYRVNMRNLFIVLTIWRHNLPYRFTAGLFGLKSHSSIVDIVDDFIDNMHKYYVPSFIGAKAWNAKRIDDELPQFVKILFPGIRIGGVGDATYIWLEKPRKNFQFQKVLWSPYKKRHMIKIHVICDAVGRVILIDGPYCGDNHNKDNKIWDSLVRNWNAKNPQDDTFVHDIHKIFDKGPGGHHFINDRGYLSCETKGVYGMKFPPRWLDPKDVKKKK